MSKIGLKTIAERLSAIEEEKKNNYQEEAELEEEDPHKFFNSMINLNNHNLQRKYDKQREELDKMEKKYQEGLHQNEIYPATSSIGKTIEYSVQFVEKYFDSFIQILELNFASNKENKSSCKFRICYSLIEGILGLERNGALSSAIKSMINEVVDLLFNRKKYDEKVDEERLRRKGLKNSIGRKFTKKLMCQK